MFRRADRAGVKHILARIIAPVDARQDQIRLGIFHHMIKPGQNAIGRAALGGIAARRQLGDHRGMGIADAMPDA